MTRYASFGFAVSFALLSSMALASPQIPTPANPYPDEPVATDGTPLKPAFGYRAQNAFSALAREPRAPRARHHR